MESNYKKFEREMVGKELAYRVKRGEVPNRKKATQAFKKLFKGLCKTSKNKRRKSFQH